MNDPALMNAVSNSVSTQTLVEVTTFSPTSVPTSAPTKAPTSTPTDAPTAGQGGGSSKKEDKYSTGGILALWIILGLLVTGGLAAAFYVLYFKEQSMKRRFGVKDPESNDPIEMAVHKSRRESYSDISRRSSVKEVNAADASICGLFVIQKIKI